MKCGPIAALAMLFLAFPLLGARGLETEEEKTVYALGLLLSKQMPNFPLDERDLEFLEQGLRDGLLRREPRVSLADYAAKLPQLAETRNAALLEAETKQAQEFLESERNVDGASVSESGVVKRVLRRGAGRRPAETDTVELHYHGTLRDGTVFDSSVRRDEPVTLPLARILPCWTEAITTMEVGEKSRFVCPPELAYGERGSPPSIRPGAALAFEMELLAIVDPPDREGGSRSEAQSPD